MNTKSKNIIEVMAKVRRKNGTIEDLGIIAEVKKPNTLQKIKNILKGDDK
jgi:hypothetical protein